MKTLTAAFAILWSTGSALAEQSIKLNDWVAFAKQTIGCASFDNAIEAERLMREGAVDAATFVERHKPDCQIFDARDDRTWPVGAVDFGSSKLMPGTFAICISSPHPVTPRSADERCEIWAVVHLRDVIRK
jgi:hypothetical protein